MEILNLGELDIDISEYLEGQTITGGGYINMEFYKLHSEFMKKNNPMHNPEVAKKLSNIMKGRAGRKLEDWEKKALSERMKKDNPAKKYPERVNTAHPINIYYEDGSIVRYEYMKLAAEETGIPYSTIQRCLLKGKKSNKWKIEKVERLEKNVTNNT